MPDTPATPPQTSNHRIENLDGLRGIAIILVIIWHYFPETHFFFPGWAGVDLFFVLSGYLITKSLLSAKGKPGYFTNFYRNRALRIFPVYYLFVIGFLLLILFALNPRNLPLFQGYLTHWKSYMIFTQNWTFIHYPVPGDISLLPLWSVAVEIQFYLIWPFVILRISRPQPLFTLLVVLFVARIAYYFLFHQSHESIYYISFFRMDGFILGSVLCLWHKRQKPLNIPTIIPAMLTILLLSVCTIVETGSPFTPFFQLIGYTLAALLFTCLLHKALQKPNAILRNKFLRLCGRISYCLYTIHMAILLFFLPRFGTLRDKLWPEHEVLFHWLAIFTSLGLSFGLSMLSYRYFESYFLRLKVRPRDA